MLALYLLGIRSIPKSTVRVQQSSSTWPSPPVCRGFRLFAPVEAGRSRPNASPFFTLSVATGCQVSRSAKFHPGVVMLAFPLARRLRSKPWCRPSPAPHDSLPGPASRTCQAVRRFLSHVIAQCLPILCAEVVSQARNQTIPVLTALHAKAEPTLQIFTDHNRPAPSACVPPRGE